MQVSPHFSLEELTRSQTALRRGIDNQPTPAQLLALNDLARDVLEPIRAQFGPFTPNSCFRSAALNRSIGGSRRSQHMKGEAADIKLPGITNLDLASWIVAELSFDQLIVEFHDPDVPHAGWVHVSYTREARRRDMLTAQRIDGKIVYAPWAPEAA